MMCLNLKQIKSMNIAMTGTPKKDSKQKCKGKTEGSRNLEASCQCFSNLNIIVLSSSKKH